MLCPHCRMDTRFTDVCEWCKKPIAAPQPTQTRTRVALTGEVIEEEVPAAPWGAPMGPVAAPGPYVPPGHPVQAPPMSGAGGTAPVPDRTIPMPPPSQQRTVAVYPPGPPRTAGMPPYGSRLGALGSTLPTQAVTAQMIRSEAALEDVDPGERWEKALAIMLPLIALSMVEVYFVRSSLFWVALADCFLSGLILGATRAIPSFDDAYLDCTAVLLICWFCGPVAGIGAYILVAAVKQEWNFAVLAVLLSHIFIRAVFTLGFPDDAPSWLTIIPYFAFISVFKIVSFVSVALSFAGWMFSNFFRPVNED